MKDTGRRWIFVGGMIRSGSTVQYQILRELVEKDLGGEAIGFFEADEIDGQLDAREEEAGARYPCLVKSHVCTPGIRERLERGGAMAFYTYRDPRDVAVSGSRNFGIPLDEFIAGRLLDQTVGEGYLWTSSPGVHTSSFETLTTGREAWIRGMMEQLGLAGDLEARAAELAADFSLERQKERIQKASHGERQGFSVDPETLLHKGHIDRAAVGGWRGQLDPAQVREIEARVGDWMADHGYRLESAGIATEPPRERERELRRRLATYFQESDRVLLERTRLVDRISVEAASLTARLVESEKTPQPIFTWAALHWRRLCRKLRGARPPFP